MQTMSEFVTRHGIGISATNVAYNPTYFEPQTNMDHWTVALGRKNQRGEDVTAVFYFSQGKGHNGAAPVAEAVLYCLVCDASALDQTFEEWCSDLDFDVDSRKAERTYKACRRNGRTLRKLLGAKLFRELRFETETL